MLDPVKDIKRREDQAARQFLLATALTALVAPILLVLLILTK